MKQVKTLLFALISITLFSCQLDAQRWSGSVKGEGELVKKSYSVDDFTGLGIGVSGKVYVKKGSSNEITIEAQQNILDNIEMEVENGSLSLEFKKNANNYKKITIWVEMDNIDKLAIGGSADIEVEDRFDNMNELKLAIGGSGSIKLAGRANQAKVSLAGSGDIDCPDLEANDVKVSIAGSGDVLIGAEDNLDVSIAGSGDVRYKGNPRVKTSIAGSGNVRTM